MTTPKTIAKILTLRKETLATAESCTGGLIGHTLTNIPGSSMFYKGGVVAYANEVKTTLLGVSRSLILRHGAVSAPVAKAMAQGIRRKTRATFGIATTGIAGPGGGTPQKPVGLVFISLSTPKGTTVKKCFFKGSRLIIKQQTAQTALRLLLNHIS